MFELKGVNYSPQNTYNYTSTQHTVYPIVLVTVYMMCEGNVHQSSNVRK